MSTLLACILALLLPMSSPVEWKAELSGDSLVITGRIAPAYYLHPLSDGGLTLSLTPGGIAEPSGAPTESFTPADYKGQQVATGTYVLRQPLTLSGGGAVEGILTWIVCLGDDCFSPEDYYFSVPVPASVASSGSGGLWKLILEAVLWGLLMLLTPCVFPMVPMTVSFFLKQSGSPARGRMNAVAYGVFIVLLYTLPICLIIGLTWAAGGAAVTADIFNWLSTHWLPNLIFFVVFMAFAASFFGLFEITLPASWSTRTFF